MLGCMLDPLDADRTLSQREAFDAPWMRRAPIIVWSELAGTTREKELRERIVVGTSPSADVVLNDRAVSRLHAELDPRDDGLWVRDLGSHNGTFVQGIRVLAANIPHGAKLQVGRTEIAVRYGEEPSPVELWPSDRFGGLIGASVAMRELFAKLGRVAQSSASVLIEGETGTGKELAAKAIHDASPRASGPFVVIDCAALPETLLEAELFGHAKGAFTGALHARPGAFEEADGGSVFLDEIGELPLNMQPKLLRVLESRTVRRIGETQHRAVDVRFISATHRDLRTLANNRAFREDLYFRIAVLPLTIPPLRERPGDIPLLIDHLLASDDGRVTSPDLLRDLASRPWFGNVRELRNFVERATTLGAPEALALAASDAGKSDEQQWRAKLPGTWLELPLRELRERVGELVDREYLARLLERCDQNVARAAAAAGVNRTYLYRLLAKHRR
jgi:transcriptional regulator with GAF, ATPase, and Fis domain